MSTIAAMTDDLAVLAAVNFFHVLTFFYLDFN
jgi:hypothetical protein